MSMIIILIIDDCCQLDVTKLIQLYIALAKKHEYDNVNDILRTEIIHPRSISGTNKPTMKQASKQTSKQRNKNLNVSVYGKSLTL